MKRRVTGIIRKANGEPVGLSSGYFVLSSNSYDSSSIYNTERIPFWTNYQGEIVSHNPIKSDSVTSGVELVCNNLLDVPTSYSCVIGGCDSLAFDFVLPSGNTSISLQALWQTTITPQDPRYVTLMTYVESVVDDAVAGVVAGANRKLVTEVYTAIATLSALRVIDMSSLGYADCSILSNMNTPKAILESAVVSGSNFTATIAGTMTDNNWQWNVNEPIYLGRNGNLTQTIDNNSVYIQQVATAISINKILINFEVPIKLL